MISKLSVAVELLNILLEAIDVLSGEKKEVM